MISRCLPIIAAFIVLIASGLVHGIWTQRPGRVSSVLDDACARVALVPLNAGEWKGTNLDVDPEQFRTTRAAAWWIRHTTKENASTPITVILMCGRPDHICRCTLQTSATAGQVSEIAGEQARETIAASARTAAWHWNCGRPVSTSPARPPRRNCPDSLDLERRRPLAGALPHRMAQGFRQQFLPLQALCGPRNRPPR